MARQEMQLAKVKTLQTGLAKMAPQLQKALPQGMMAERFMRIALTTVQKTPELLECTSRSVLNAVLESCQLGLALDGVLGHAYPVPFKTKGTKICQMMIGYRGFILLAWRSAEILIDASIVREGDTFEYMKGTGGYIRHWEAVGDPGECTHAYSIARFPDGREKFEIMTRADLDRIQLMSKASGPESPWQKHPDQMRRKCPIRALAKTLPLTGELITAAVRDEQREFGVDKDTGLIIDTDAMGLDAETASDLKTEELKQKLESEKEEQAAEAADAEAEKAEKKPDEKGKGKAKAQGKKETPLQRKLEEAEKKGGKE